MNNPESTSTPSACARGCGFFGSAENHNLCSNCYKDYLKELIAKSSSASASSLSDAAAAAASPDTTATTTEPVQINRCDGCKKKLRMMRFTCRCGKSFCANHRYPKDHACTFDFKAFDREILAKQNPALKSDRRFEKF